MEYNEHEEKRKELAKETANQVTNMLNDFGFNPEYFFEAMSREHRTLQQNFTRMVLQWLEYIASDKYLTDPRNEDSKRTAQKLLEGFNQVSDVAVGVSPPSRWLGHV